MVTLNYHHHIFSMKSPSSSSSLSSMKLKSLVQTFRFSHLFRIARALITKAKSMLIEVLKDIHSQHLLELLQTKKSSRNKNKLLFGSFRLHYNWSSSHVMPLPADMTKQYNEFEEEEEEEEEDAMAAESSSQRLSGYLQWLDEKGHEDSDDKASDDINEIDKLADMFIESCHEKFRLEKEESYRRFQEMMARSV